MNAPVDSWHAQFNPSKFLSRVNLALLIERTKVFQENTTQSAPSPCLLCGKAHPRGVILNNKSFLCERCYGDVSLISYPEKYEALHRNFLIATEARRLAWEGFCQKFEYKGEESALVFLGWGSLVLAFIHPAFLVLTAILLAIGYQANVGHKHKTEEWQKLKTQWERENPQPIEPVLRHFHDPAAELTARDRQILYVFNHWPGYPPFWKYLRGVVLTRDGNRCQVTGCPSRLTLHVHHKLAVAAGGTHTPDNLVSLCDFHHALEPEPGHERIWGEIKTRFFTMVPEHERSNRGGTGMHTVRAHLRRLELITLNDLRDLTKTYGFCCPSCGDTHLSFTLNSGKNVVRVECRACGRFTEGPQQLTEETGPHLAEILGVSRNKGQWRSRWDMLDDRKQATWGTWSGKAIENKRRQHKEAVKRAQSAPTCPKCGSPMRLIKPRPGQKWTAFWGCTKYASEGCKGSHRYVPLEGV